MESGAATERVAWTIAWRRGDIFSLSHATWNFLGMSLPYDYLLILMPRCFCSVCSTAPLYQQRFSFLFYRYDGACRTVYGETVAIKRMLHDGGKNAGKRHC